MSDKIILQNKLDSMINNNREKTLGVVDRIENDCYLLQDAIVPFGPMSQLRFHANGEFCGIINGDQLRFHDNALTQLSTQFNIPSAYSKKLVQTEWGRKLLEETFTKHNDFSQRKRMLVRSVGDEIRGILSDAYRRLDSRLIYSEFIRESKAVGAEFVDALYTPVKSYMTVVFPKIYEIPTQNNGSIYSAFGARISNSDFGQAGLSVNAFQMNVVCSNGLVSKSTMNVKHLGKRLSPDLKLSERTYRLDTETMASAVKDVTSNMLSHDTILATAQKIKSASEEVIDMDMSIKRLPKDIHKSEIESIRNILQNGNVEQGIYGAPTKWKLSQAITAAANEVGGSRKQDLDEIAGKLLKL